MLVWANNCFCKNNLCKYPPIWPSNFDRDHFGHLILSGTIENGSWGNIMWLTLISQNKPFLFSLDGGHIYTLRSIKKKSNYIYRFITKNYCFFEGVCHARKQTIWLCAVCTCITNMWTLLYYDPHVNGTTANRILIEVAVKASSNTHFINTPSVP